MFSGTGTSCVERAQLLLPLYGVCKSSCQMQGGETKIILAGSVEACVRSKLAMAFTGLGLHRCDVVLAADEVTRSFSSSKNKGCYVRNDILPGYECCS